ncbi:hypothetical protein BDV06DRAFT_226358 [Aspergillus oleicola]
MKDFKDYLLLEVVVNRSNDEVNQLKGDPDLSETGNPRAEKQVIPYANRRYARWRDLTCGCSSKSTEMPRADVFRAMEMGEISRSGSDIFRLHISLSACQP